MFIYHSSEVINTSKTESKWSLRLDYTFDPRDRNFEKMNWIQMKFENFKFNILIGNGVLELSAWQNNHSFLSIK